MCSVVRAESLTKRVRRTLEITILDVVYIFITNLRDVIHRDSIDNEVLAGKKGIKEGLILTFLGKHIAPGLKFIFLFVNILSSLIVHDHFSLRFRKIGVLYLKVDAGLKPDFPTFRCSELCKLRKFRDPTCIDELRDILDASIEPLVEIYTHRTDLRNLPFLEIVFRVFSAAFYGFLRKIMYCVPALCPAIICRPPLEMR